MLMGLVLANLTHLPAGGTLLAMNVIRRESLAWGAPATSVPTATIPYYAWPRQPLPDVLVEPLPDVEVVDGGARFKIKASKVFPFPETCLPDEAFAREALEVDLADPASIAAFMSEFGLLTDRGGYPLRALPDPMKVETLFGVRRGRPDYASLGAPSEWPSPQPPDFFVFIIPAEAAAEHLRVLRTLVGHWRAHTDGGDVTKPWTEFGYDLVTRGLLRESHWPEESAWFLFSWYLNTALEVFHAHLALPWGIFPSTPTTYQALCLQLFNHIVEGAGFRICANETCGRFFWRQRGRAKYRQFHTTGVRYCSRTCARAQAARELRRRKKGAST